MICAGVPSFFCPGQRTDGHVDFCASKPEAPLSMSLRETTHDDHTATHIEY